MSPSTPEDALYFIKNYKIDYIQTNFNLLDQRIIDNGLMKLAKIKKIKIIARTPLVFGFLSNKINIKKLKKDKNDHRSFWSIEQLKNGKTLMFYLIKFEVEILLHYWHLIIVYLILKLDMPYPA